MHTLDFRNWFENLDDPLGIQNPEAIAKHWKTNTPTEPTHHNDAAINEFAQSMAKASTGTNLARHLNRYEVHDLAYHDKPIGNNLLDISDQRLGYARGYITNQEEPEFNFFMGGSRAGSMLIQHEPVVYTPEDTVLMASVVKHELGHAVDWLDPKYKYAPPSGRYKWNAEAYAKNIHEARQYSNQLKYLLKQVGSVNKVIDLLGKSGPMRLAPALVPVAQEFLKEYAVENGLKLEIIDPFHPTALVASHQDEFAKSAAAILGKIVQSMQLRNFVRN